MVRTLVSLGLALLAIRPSVQPHEKPASWSQWRGPLATGEAPAARPPVEWSETKNIRWKVEIPGQGASTPIIWGDTIYLQTAVPVGDEKATRQQFTVGFQRSGESVYHGQAYVQSQRDHEFQLLAVDRASGAIRWRKTLRTEQPREGRHPTNTWASASPSTDGRRIIACFGSRGLYAVSPLGDVLWEVDLGEMDTRNGWGEGASPALYADRVIVTWDHEGRSFIAALDADNGREIWRRDRDEPTTWATPLVVEAGGRRQVVANGTRHVRGYDFQTGNELWSGPGLTFNSIPSPVASGTRAYFTSGFEGSRLLAIDLASAHGAVTDGGALRWRHDRDTPYVASPLLYRGRLYVFKGLTGILTVLDAASGAVLHGPRRFSEIPDLYASPVAADGRIYVAGRDGATVVFDHAPPFETRAVNHLDDGFDASPAAVDDELYLRGRRYLYKIAATAAGPMPLRR